MFNPWRQYLPVVIAALLPMLAALWAAILSKPTTPTYERVLYVCIIGLVSGSAAYFTQIKPAANLQKPVLTLLTDDQTQQRVREQAEAIEHILRLIGERQIEWTAGTVLASKLSRNPDSGRRQVALKLLARPVLSCAHPSAIPQFKSSIQ